MAPGFPGIHHMRAEEARATVDWVRAIPLIVVHVLCLGVFLVGWSWTAVSVAIGLYFIRMFAIRAGTIATFRFCSLVPSTLGIHFTHRNDNNSQVIDLLVRPAGIEPATLSLEG